MVVRVSYMESYIQGGAPLSMPAALFPHPVTPNPFPQTPGGNQPL